LKIEKKQVKESFLRFCEGFRTRNALPLLAIVLPILFLIAVDPASFGLVSFFEREIGRAGLIFVFFLVAWDWHDSRERFIATRSQWRQLLSIFVLIAVLTYYYLIDVLNINASRVYVTSQLGVSQESTLSFFAAMDFIVFAIYCLATVAILYSPKTMPLMVTPVIYSVGSGILAAMDAFFPQDSLAFLQIWVYVIWNVVVSLLGLLGFHTNINPYTSPTIIPALLLQGNRLYLWGKVGFMELEIFWPSSGVVSMIVYSLVLIVLLVKLDAPRKRKALYAIIGAAGTYFVNVIRITLIVLYVAYVSLDVEAFHQSIGEVLFILWIFIYLLVVIRMENISYRKEVALPQTKPTSQPGTSKPGVISSSETDSSPYPNRQ
jgi:thaumarchaeosortase